MGNEAETAASGSENGDADLAHWAPHMTTSPGPSTGTSRLVPGLVAGAAALWTAGVVLAPWLTAHDSSLGGWLRLLYRPGCHQIADRCIDLGFGPMAVCARCIGLYLGGTLALLTTTITNRSMRPHPIWLLVTAAPTVLDFAAGQLGLPALGNWTRFFVALPLGFLAGLYLGDALIEVVRVNSKQHDSNKSDRDSLG